MSRRVRRRRGGPFSMVVVLIAVAAFFGGALYAAFRAELIAFGLRPGGRDVGARIVVTIERGATAADVGRVLEDSGIVVDGKAFAGWLVKVARAEQTIKAGTYVLSPEMTPDEVLQELQKGLQHELRFTIPEGSDQAEIAGILHRTGFGDVDGILSVMADPDFVAECGAPAGVPGGVEGYLFPDTYQFPPGTPIRRILRRMCTRLHELVTDELRQSMATRGMTLHDALTLASIIEEEAAVGRERRRISGVFHRRLRKGMKLQTDPTVLYGVEPRDPEQPRRIRRSDLQRETPYNTYVITGLPPGPISSPGLACIKAAISPDDDDSLFFVARGDGTHEFCATLQCHEDAVARYIHGEVPVPAPSPSAPLP